MDSVKIIGILFAVLLPAVAGHMSFGMPGFIVGSAIGVALVFGVLRVIQAPTDESKPFDLMPPETDYGTSGAIDDRPQSLSGVIGRDDHGTA